jgi:uncharacterized protein
MSGKRLLSYLIPLVVIFGCIRVLEHRMIYHPQATVALTPNDPWSSLMPHVQAQFREVNFVTGDGVQINSWYCPARNKQPTIVYAHGNGGNLADRWAFLLDFCKHGYGLLAFDYRGYGKSKGIPSESGLYMDLEAASLFLERQYQIPVQQQVAMGGSLGGGVVADVATRLPFRAIVLYSTFTSLDDMALHLQKNKWGSPIPVPLGWLMSQHFDSESKIKKIRSPLLVAHSTHDELIPMTMGERLYRKAASRKKIFLQEPGNVHGVSSTLLIQGLEQLLAESEPD